MLSSSTIKILRKMDVRLSPDFYEIFPIYSTHELAERIDQLPFHLATLLNPNNILRAKNANLISDELVNFLNSPYNEQRSLLCEVLTYVGISERTVLGMQRVKREEFVPPKYKSLSYLDTFIPFSYTSCLSSPSIVALMIDLLDVSPNRKILEIGLGSGYHATCLANSLKGDCTIIGVEVNPQFFNHGCDVLRDWDLNIDCHQGSELELLKARERFDYIYTASTLSQVPSHFYDLLEKGGKLQLALPVSPGEFVTEKATSWLRTAFSSYIEYISSKWEQNFARLVTYELEDGSLKELNKVYDVIFVPYHSEVMDDTSVLGEYQTLSELLKWW